MSSWMNEAAAIPNHAGNGFPHMGDPNSMAGAGMMDPSAFMQNAGQFNPNAANPQFTNHQQMAAAMQNGQMRNASPSFSNPVYQTNQVIPSKRPRPREDSIGASPRQNPGMLPTSRADTPQQSQFPGFQTNAMQPQNAGQPQHFPHLQPNGSATASPSPVMAGNQLRPGSVPQRVNTASPHPFSPASQQFGPQGSPVPSDHGGTPQPGMFMNPQGFPQGYNPNFAPSASPARPPSAQNPMTPQMMQHQMGPMGQMGQMGQVPQQMPQMHPNQIYANQQMQQMQMHQMQMQQMQAAQAMQGRGMDPKMLYQMRMQQQYAQGNIPSPADMQAQNMAQGRGLMAKQGMPMQNGQMPPAAMRPQQLPQMARGINPEVFVKNLTGFINARQLPLEMNPTIDGRPLHLFQVFQQVQKYSGYRNVSANNLWPHIAAQLGFPPNQSPTAPLQLKGIYERNLYKFEEAWVNQQRNQQMKGPGPGNMPPNPVPVTPQRMAQISPAHNMSMTPTQPQMPIQNARSPAKGMMPGVQQGATTNGFPTPQHAQMPQPQASPGPNSIRNSVPRSVEATPVNAEFPIQSPGPAGKPSAVPPQHPSQQPDGVRVNGTSALPFPAPSPNDDVYSPLSRALAQDHGGSWGGLEVDATEHLGFELGRVKPDMPGVMELGNIDIQALAKSIQSGIHGEVRLALDVLATVTRYGDAYPFLNIELQYCDDLIDTLLDCAEEQIDLLADNAEPVSDEIDLSCYEDILRVARAEQYHLRKVPVFGDAEYELERAADRLLAITTILRNLSFFDKNQPFLADEVVIKFLCGLIRSLGTHESLLKTAQNTLDVMKDVVVLLSNIAAEVELPGRDQAFCLLQFILSFAPSPAPFVAGGNLVFSSFEPSVHKYLPHALDALAKLLARDEPNRTHYKAIIAADAFSSTPYELLTRAFALVISPIPNLSIDVRPGILPPSVDARKPLLMQGMLAADIIAQLAPGHETGVTRSWLSSSDGFAQKLLILVKIICQHIEHPVARPGTNPRGQHREDPDLLYIVTCAVSALRRLCEKARDPSDVATIPPNALLTRASLFECLNNLKTPKWAFLLNQLNAYVGLEN